MKSSSRNKCSRLREIEKKKDRRDIDKADVSLGHFFTGYLSASARGLIFFGLIWLPDERAQKVVFLFLFLFFLLTTLDSREPRLAGTSVQEKERPGVEVGYLCRLPFLC